MLYHKRPNCRKRTLLMYVWNGLLSVGILCLRIDCRFGAMRWKWAEKLDLTATVLSSLLATDCITTRGQISPVRMWRFRDQLHVLVQTNSQTRRYAASDLAEWAVGEKCGKAQLMLMLCYVPSITCYHLSPVKFWFYASRIRISIVTCTWQIYSLYHAVLPRNFEVFAHDLHAHV